MAGFGPVGMGGILPRHCSELTKQDKNNPEKTSWPSN